MRSMLPVRGTSERGSKRGGQILIDVTTSKKQENFLSGAVFANLNKSEICTIKI